MDGFQFRNSALRQRNTLAEKATQECIESKLQPTRSGPSGKARTHPPTPIFESSTAPAYLPVSKELDSDTEWPLLPQVIHPISSLLSEKPRKSTKNKRTQSLSTATTTASNLNAKSSHGTSKLADPTRPTGHKSSKFKPKSKVSQLEQIDSLHSASEPFVPDSQERENVLGLVDKVINTVQYPQLQLKRTRAGDKYGQGYEAVQLTSGTIFEVRVYSFHQRTAVEKHHVRRNCREWKKRRRFRDSYQEGHFVFLILRYPESQGKSLGQSPTRNLDNVPRSYTEPGDGTFQWSHTANDNHANSLLRDYVPSATPTLSINGDSVAAAHKHPFQPDHHDSKDQRITMSELSKFYPHDLSFMSFTSDPVTDISTMRSVMLQLGAAFFFRKPKEKTRPWIEKTRRNQRRQREEKATRAKFRLFDSSISSLAKGQPTEGNSYYYSSDWYDSPPYGRFRKVVLLHSGVSKWWGNALLLDDEAQDAWWMRDKYDDYYPGGSKVLPPPPFMPTIEDIVKSASAVKSPPLLIGDGKGIMEHEPLMAQPAKPAEEDAGIAERGNIGKGLNLYSDVFGPAVLKFNTNKSRPLIEVMLNFWFSSESLLEDKLQIRKHMDSEGFIHLIFIATLRGIKALMFDLDVLRAVCKESDLVEYRKFAGGNEKVRRKDGWEKWVLPEKMREPSARGRGSEVDVASRGGDRNDLGNKLASGSLIDAQNLSGSSAPISRDIDEDHRVNVAETTTTSVSDSDEADRDQPVSPEAASLSERLKQATNRQRRASF